MAGCTWTRTPRTRTSDMAAVPSLETYWLAETVRLREAHWGPLEDSAEVRRVRAARPVFPSQILLRAQLLGQRERLDLLIRKWVQAARIALAILIAASAAAGMAAALGALGDGTR